MPGFADIALGAAPIAGGALLGAVAGSLKGPDFRGMIKADLELLEVRHVDGPHETGHRRFRHVARGGELGDGNIGVVLQCGQDFAIDRIHSLNPLARRRKLSQQR